MSAYLLLLDLGNGLVLGGAGLGHELDDDDLSGVTLAGAKLHDAGVATVAVGPHALSGLLEDLAHDLLVANLCDGEAAGVQVALLGPGDDLVHVGTNGLGAGLKGLDTIIGKQGRIAKAIRTVVKAASVKDNQSVNVEIVSEDEIQ